MFEVRFDNIANNETVYTRLVILSGSVLEGGGEDGYLTVESLEPSARLHPIEDAAWQTWEVNAGYFKILLPLVLGQNEVRVRFRSSSSGRDEAEVTLRLTYERDMRVPPLQLCMLAASDSPLYSTTSNSTDDGGSNNKMESLKRKMLGNSSRRKYELPHDEAGPRALVDAPPGHAREKLRRGGLDEIKRRLCLQVYLWQAFHAEEMRRHGLDRRAFQLEDTTIAPAQRPLSLLADVHLLRSKHTLAEFLDKDNAQQQKNAKNGGAMHVFAGEAIREAVETGTAPFHRDSPLAVLILDTRWDYEASLLRGHAAVGAATRDDFSYGVMGSHFLWSAPSNLNEVTFAFTNEAKTETQFVVNDLNECPTAWQTLNIGSGAMLHEVGHALDNPHWPDGIMARGYVEFNRAFCTREPPRAPASKGTKPITPNNDAGKNHLHRCQAVRAFHHPCFRIPADLEQWGPHAASTSITPGLTGQGPTLSNESGIASIEISVGETHKTHIEYVGRAVATRSNGGGTASPKKLQISPYYLSQLLHFDVMDPRSPTVSLNVVGANLRQEKLSDYRDQGFAQLVHVTEKTDDPRPIYKGAAAGNQDGGSLRQTQIFPSKLQPSIFAMIGIDIYVGAALDAFTFHFHNWSTNARSTVHVGPPQNDKVPNCQFAIREAADSIARLELRCGAWIDAVNIIMTSGAQSGWYGNVEGGSQKVLEAPQGQEIVGLFCSAGQWCDSIGILIR
ncbi:hypothetical protein FA10DRAFT_268451 [Acaromyces ingoldii]|uniref:Jacalin-type lectin domain-containing protein n=1 Tax=Acaromyces ingoldii TaxID=215250 RepID=A0A316YGK1_9BASI|nr:hypothetical protein FA10DRAFT_268451 [Acaromyces ingoldii]PWN88246.1 hypothetical protein FA10DRAFT_268451 [Acaromyces ingoldii]